MWRSVVLAMWVLSACAEPCLVPGEYDFFATGLAPDFREVAGTFVISTKEATLTTTDGQVHRCTLWNVDDSRGSPSHVCIINWECEPSPKTLRVWDTLSGDDVITGGTGMFGAWSAARRSP